MPVLLTREEALGQEYPADKMPIVQEGFFKEDREALPSQKLQTPHSATGSVHYRTNIFC
jgi:hypothetical protein